MNDDDWIVAPIFETGVGLTPPTSPETADLRFETGVGPTTLTPTLSARSPSLETPEPRDASAERDRIERETLAVLNKISGQLEILVNAVAYAPGGDGAKRTVEEAFEMAQEQERRKDESSGGSLINAQSERGCNCRIPSRADIR